jgi:hypothetical protein
VLLVALPERGTWRRRHRGRRRRGRFESDVSKEASGAGQAKGPPVPLSVSTASVRVVGDGARRGSERVPAGRDAAGGKIV